MSDQIKAGEAWVKISCDSTAMVKGLQETLKKISETASRVSSIEGDLSPKVEIQGEENFRRSIREVRDELEKTANSGKNLSNRLVITAGDIYNAFSGAVRKLSTLLGGVGDSFDKMALRTGISTEALSEWKHAAERSGAELSNIEGAVRSMQSRIGDANAGMAKAQKVFERLGVDLTSLSGLSPERQFDRLASAVASVQDPTERASIALKVFGSDGQRLLPMFSSGSAGIASLREEARRLGVSVDEASAKMGAEFVDSTTRFKAALTGLGLTISKAVTPAVTEALNRISSFVSKLIAWSKEHPFLSDAILRTVATLGALAAAVAVGHKAWTTFASAAQAARTALVALRGLAVANPWLAMAAAIAAAVVAINALTAAKTKYSTSASESLEEGDEQRKEDYSALERLKELEKIQRTQKLSNDQVNEAIKLAEELRSRYGDLGIEVDAITGKIKGATAAQDEMTRRAREARKQELEAALAEAEANSDEEIRRGIANDAIKWYAPEFLLGKKKTQTWGQWATSWEWENTMDSAKVKERLLEGDEAFEKKVAAAIQKNNANKAIYKAQLDAMKAEEERGRGDVPSVFSLDQEALDKGGSAVADFIKRASDEEKSELDQRIDAIVERRDQLIGELRKLADPSGEIDWNDAAAVQKLFAESPTARALQELATQVDAAANAQVERERAKERERLEEEAHRKSEAALKELAALDERRADAKKTELERSLDAIDKETAKYREQLQILREIEAAKENPNQATLANLDKRLRDATAAGETAKAAEREKYVADKMEKAFEKLATPQEKLARAAEELQVAMFELATARDAGDRVQVAAALEKLGDAQSKYESLADAVGSVKESLKKTSGTFNAWEASATSYVDIERRLYSETRTQTSYLREIARNVGRQAVAVFA